MAVVVGYAATPEGGAALRKAVEESRLRGARLIVVAVARGEEDSGAGAASAEGELAEVLTGLDVAGIAHEVRPATGDAELAEDLMSVARETGAQLIVIGLRRRSPVGKLILGSNAQRVLLEAPCPVLTVKVES
jgi:nucleotide-binding universal stress UspA family protein